MNDGFCPNVSLSLLHKQNMEFEMYNLPFFAKNFSSSTFLLSIFIEILNFNHSKRRDYQS